ncbi:MAG: hypothetical protein R3B74_15090 [Nitrospirales bacterium]|nr:hypothetical protein [Nitrospirales bacterium]
MTRSYYWITGLYVFFVIGGGSLVCDSAFGQRAGPQGLVLPNKDQILTIPNVIQRPLPDQASPAFRTPSNSSPYSSTPMLQNPMLSVPSLPKVNPEPSAGLSGSSATLFQTPHRPEVSGAISTQPGLSSAENRPSYPSKEILTNTPSASGGENTLADFPSGGESRISTPNLEVGTFDSTSLTTLKANFEQSVNELDSFSKRLEQLELVRTELKNGVELTPDMQNVIMNFEERFFPGFEGLPPPPISVGGGQGIPNPIDKVIQPAGGQGNGSGSFPITNPSGTQEGPGSVQSDREPRQSLKETSGANAGRDGGASEGTGEGTGGITGNNNGVEGGNNQIAQKKEWAQRLERLLEEGGELLKSKQKETQHLHVLVLQQQIHQEDRNHAQRNIPLPPGFPRK